MCSCQVNCSLSGNGCCRCLDTRVMSSKKRGVPRNLRNKSIFAQRTSYVDGKKPTKNLDVFWADYCPNCQFHYSMMYGLIQTLTFTAGNYVGSVSIPPGVDLAEFIMENKIRLSGEFNGVNITFLNPLKSH